MSEIPQPVGETDLLDNAPVDEQTGAALADRLCGIVEYRFNNPRVIQEQSGETIRHTLVMREHFDRDVFLDQLRGLDYVAVERRVVISDEPTRRAYDVNVTWRDLNGRYTQARVRPDEMPELTTYRLNDAGERVAQEHTDFNAGQAFRLQDIMNAMTTVLHRDAEITRQHERRGDEHDDPEQMSEGV